MKSSLAIAGLAAALLVSAPPPVRAAARPKGGSVCPSASKQADALVSQGKLRQARRWLQKCAQASCSVPLRRDCKARLARLAMDIPSIVPMLTDEEKQPITDVEVAMDGHLLTTKADGRAVAVDPGKHEFTFKTVDGRVVTQEMVVVQGEHRRKLEASLPATVAAAATPTAAATPAAATPTAAAAARPAEEQASEDPPARTGDSGASRSRYEEPPERQSTAGHPVAPWVLTGLGLASLGAFGVLTQWGRLDDQKLVKECSPDCKPESIDHVRNLYLGAKISLGVGLAALGVATVLFISNGSSDTREVASAKPTQRYVFDVRPGPSGAVAGVSGTF